MCISIPTIINVCISRAAGQIMLVRLPPCFAIWKQQTHRCFKCRWSSLKVLFTQFPQCLYSLDFFPCHCFTLNFHMALSICYPVHLSYTSKQNAKSPFLLLSGFGLTARVSNQQSAPSATITCCDTPLNRGSIILFLEHTGERNWDVAC